MDEVTTKINTMTWRRRWLKGGIILAVLLFFLAAALIYLQSGHFSALLLSHLNQRLNLQFGLTIKADFLRLNPWQFKIKAKNIRVFALSTFPKSGYQEYLISSAKPLFSTKELDINFSLWPLLRRRIHLQKVKIIEPTLAWRRLDFLGERRNKPESIKIKEKISRKFKPWSFRIDHLLIEAGRFSLSESFSRTAWLQSIFLDNIEVGLKFDEKKMEHDGWITTGQGRVELAGQSRFIVASTLFLFRFDEKEVILTEAIVESEALNLKAEARVKLKPQISLFQAIIEGEMQAEKMPFFWNKEKIAIKTPPSVASFELTSGINSPLVSAPGMVYKLPNSTKDIASESKNGSFSHPFYRQFSVEGKINFTFSLKEAEKGWVGQGRINATNFALANLEAAPLCGQIELLVPLVSGKADFSQLEANFRFKLSEPNKKLSFSKGQIELLTGQIRGNYKNKELNLAQFSLVWAGISLSASGQFKPKQELITTFTLTTENLGRSLSELRKRMLLPFKVLEEIEKPKVQMERKPVAGKLRLDGHIKGLWPKGNNEQNSETKGYLANNEFHRQRKRSSWPELQGKISLEGSALQGPFWTDGHLEAKIDLKKRKINFAHFAFSSPEFEVNLDGSFTLDPLSHDFGLQSNLKLKLAIAEIKNWESILPAQFQSFLREKGLLPLGGCIKLEATLAGPVNQSPAHFWVQAKELRAGKMEVVALKAEGQGDIEKVQITNLQLQKSDGQRPLSASLNFDWKRKIFKITIEADSLELGDWVELIPSSTPAVIGQVGFRLEAMGSLDNYELTYRIEGKEIKFWRRGIAPSLVPSTSFPFFSVPIFSYSFSPTSSCFFSFPSLFYFAPGCTFLPSFFFPLFSFASKIDSASENLAIYFSENNNPGLGSGDRANLTNNLINYLKFFNFSPLLPPPLYLPGSSYSSALISSGQARPYLPLITVPAVRISGRLTVKMGSLTFFNLKADFGGNGTGPAGFRIGSFEITTAEPLELLLQDDLLLIRGFDWKSRDLNFRLVGGLGFKSRKAELKIEARLPFLLLVEFFSQVRPSDNSLKKVTARGEILFQGQVSGNISHFAEIEPNLELIISDGQLAWPIYPGQELIFKHINLRAKLNQIMLTIDNLSLNLGNGQIVARGLIPLSGLRANGRTREAQINLAFSQLNPWDFIPVQINKIPASLKEKFAGKTSGELSGEINVSFIPEPKQWRPSLKAELKVETLRLSLDHIILANKEPIIFNVEPDLITLKKVEISGKSGSLKVKAKLRHPFSQPQAQSELDVSLQAFGDLEALSPWLKDVTLRGNVTISLSLAGSLAKIEPKATIEFRQLAAEKTDLPLRLSEGSGYFFLAGNKLEINSCRGLINGAPWEISGFLEVGQDGQIKSTGINLIIKDLPIEIKDTMATALDAYLDLNSDRGRLFLAGDITAKGMTILADINSLGPWLRRRASFRRPSPTPEPQFLENIYLNLKINLFEPALVTNSFLRTSIEGGLTISGNLAQPIILGRLVNAAAGEFTWAERRYQLEKMQIDFTGSFPPDPKLEIIAQTDFIHRYDQVEVKLLLNGPISNLRLSFQSTPPRSQEELAFLLLTGKSLEEIRREGLSGLREQILLALATPVASRFGAEIRRIIGVEEMRIEPLGIAGETDPGARLTLVKQITPAARLVTSVDITNSQRQSWNLDYRLSRGMLLNLFRRDDGSYGTGLRHSLSLGGEKRKGEGSKVSPAGVSAESFSPKIISSLKIKGDPFFTSELIQGKIRSLQPGKTFSHRLLDQQMKLLESFYHRHQFFQAKINPQIISEAEGKVDIILEINAGPRIEIEYCGYSPSRRLRHRVETLWSRETSPERAAKGASALVAKNLVGQGYYQANVKSVLKVEEKRIANFIIVNRGHRYQIKEVRVVGASPERARRLQQQIKSWRREEAKGFWLLITDPRLIMEAIRNWYEQQGFLEAKAAVSIEEDKEMGLLTCVLEVEEGPQSFVEEVKFEGNQAVSATELKSLVRTKAGEPFNPTLLLSDRNRLLSFYRRHGYQDVSVTSRVEFSQSGEEAKVIFTIEEGVIHRVAEVEFDAPKEEQRRQLSQIFGLKPGERLTFERISEGQKALYDIGDFNLVQVRTEPTTEPGLEKVRVELRREPAINFRYGLRYDSEAKTEVTAGLDFRHLFGLGRQGLTNFIYNERLKDWRFSFHDRNFLGLKVDSLLSFYATRKKEAGFTTDEMGASWRQQFKLPGKILLSLVARRSSIHTYEAETEGPFLFDISLSLTELSLQAIRDLRDDPFDPHRGSFFSSSLTYSPKQLKSELTYFSWFGQASFYQPLSSRLVFASNFRLGLATAFDQVMVPARRFYAGGGYSIRGFKQDMVGPYDPYLKQPEGGEAVFISNQELRLAILPGVDGVIFYDSGNVFPEVKNLKLSHLRHSAGVGLRLWSPLGLLRFDLGFNLRPRAGEPRTVFFFTLGPLF